MQNVGTWNSDFAVFLFFVMMLPIVISITTNCIKSCSPPKDTIQPSKIPFSDRTNVSSNVVRLDDTSMAVLQVELKSIKDKLHRYTSQSKPKKTTKRKSSKRHKETKKPAVDSKEKEMMQEASIALNKLGVQKSHANSIMRDLCKEKTYTSSEDLIRDAIVYV